MNAARFGILSAIFASLCCVGPLLLLALGLGSLGFGTVLGRYHWGFTGVAVLLLTTGWYRYVKEQSRCRTQQCQMARAGMTRWTLMAASVLVATFAGLNAWSTFAQPSGSVVRSPNSDGTTVTIPTRGMTCAMCEVAIERSLAKHPGVLSVDAQLATEQVVITYDPRKVRLSELMTVINKTGYQTQSPSAVEQP